MKHVSLCNNCGKKGHVFKNCKLPITSLGVVQFRIHNNVREYLLICRKDTLGYIDFLRGKYSLHDRNYIINMMKQMTIIEKTNLKTNDFNTLWNGLWNNKDSSVTFNKCEEDNSRTKFELLKKTDLISMIDESNEYNWTIPEWGFPKGRRNYQEKDYECALRETCEETGYKECDMINIRNILPFEEVFTGSNYKTYKHKYYLMYMEYSKTLKRDKFDHTEVSLMEWKTYDECMKDIRHYNIEKKRLLTRIEETLIQIWKFL